MKDKVLSIVRKYNLIKENENIVVGVSGGPDSMALLYVLLDIRDSINFNIHMAHVNHGVRGNDARKDQLFVEEQAKKLSLPYYTKNVDMIAYGKKRGITSEEAGRELRYGFFREILKKQGGGKIAVAHNKNDQAETLIMRFMRGTGVDGLKGMEFIYKDIIRPILSIDRQEIEKYIENREIETVLDKTNLQPIYTRNKVRLELIPYIQENFNPNIVNTLWRMSRVSAIDSNFLEEYTEKKYNKLVKKEEENSIILDGGKLYSLDKSIQQRVIRNAIQKINGSFQGITEIQILSVLNLILKGKTGKGVNLINNIVARVNYDELIIEKDNKVDTDDYLYKFYYLGVVNLEELGYSFNMEIIENRTKIEFKKSKYIKYFDLDKIKGDLSVRNRRAGDRFSPFGMKGTKKLKDYFIDEKVPKELRDKNPLIVDEKNILWVVGYRTNEKYRVTKDTKRILKISYNYIK